MASTGSGKSVLIAGGGIAALEALLALRDLTGGEAEITLLSPDREFTYRPLLVTEPFGPEPATRRDLPAALSQLGSGFVEDRLVALDGPGRVASTSRSGEIAFDYALIAIGAHLRPSIDAAHTLWIEHHPAGIDAILDRARERGALELIVPPGVTWSLPLYEFALMASRRLKEREEETPIRVTTPEQSPLTIFGRAASEEVAGLLAARGIDVRAGTWVSESGSEFAGTGGMTDLTGYPVALPGLEGIRIEGLPADHDGFTPVDEHCRVRGLERVWAAGDGTDFPVKQGGLATQQADAAARAIAAEMGFDAEPRPFRPVLRGRLLTGHGSVSMLADLAGGAGEGAFSSDYLWWPPHKVSGQYLAPWLAHEEVRADPDPPERTLDVEVSLPPEGLPDLLGRIGESPAG